MARLQIAFRTETGKDAPTESESFFCKDNLFLVAEGVGGDYLGDMAKEAAYKGVPTHFFKFLSEERSPGTALISALKAVNEEVLNERKKIAKKMAASVSVIYIAGKIMYFCHLGDSRIYCLQRGEIVQLTRDHTVGEEKSYAEMGGGDPRILRALTDGLGIHEKPDIKMKTFALRDKDVILMTTEGLTRYLSNMQILQLSMKQNSVKRLSERLIEEAQRKGARDSMTLGIIRIKEFPLTLNRKAAACAAVLLAATLAGGYALKSKQEPAQPAQERVHQALSSPSKKNVEKSSNLKPAGSDQPHAQPPRATRPQEEVKREETKKSSVPLDQEIHQFLKEWKTAWEKTAGPEGNISGYMSLYAEDFNSEGMDKNSWRHGKAERNKKKQWIKIELKEIAIGTPSPDNRLEVRFLQEYKSSNFSVRTNKSLVLKKGGAGWRIVSEKAT